MPKKDKRAGVSYQNAGSSYLSATQVAEALGISRSAVWLRIHNGQIMAHRIGGGWVVPAAEVERTKPLLRADAGGQREEYNYTKKPRRK